MKTRRIIAWGALALIVLLAGGVALYAHLMTPKLQLGVGYGARVACGCRYIEGRPLKSCYKDFEPGMEVIHLADDRSEEHTSELQSLMRISYAVFCLKKKKTTTYSVSRHQLHTLPHHTLLITPL